VQTLTDQQHRLLVALMAAGHATSHELAEATALPAMAVAKLLRELEGERQVAKDLDASRDAIVWQVTARGADVLDMES
jgi:DNA-binding MarR family transcriptional regulator